MFFNKNFKNNYLIYCKLKNGFNLKKLHFFLLLLCYCDEYVNKCLIIKFDKNCNINKKNKFKIILSKIIKTT